MRCQSKLDTKFDNHQNPSHQRYTLEREMRAGYGLSSGGGAWQIRIKLFTLYLLNHHHQHHGFLLIWPSFVVVVEDEDDAETDGDHDCDDEQKYSINFIEQICTQIEIYSLFCFVFGMSLFGQFSVSKTIKVAGHLFLQSVTLSSG